MPATLASDTDIATPITCILSDVDGVLTDGQIIYDSAGNDTKRFHVRDGLAIKLWMVSGFEFGIITARNSEMVQRRCQELGIERVSQGSARKWEDAQAVIESLGITPENVCYIGDDLPDIPVMRRVGLAVAPADAARDARETAAWVLQHGGGQGALRELIERLLRAKKRWEEHLANL